MQAFVSNWTRPYAVRCPDRPYQMTDFDLLTTVLSALVWRRENGSIRMITDDTGAQYYRSLGLTDLWDGGIFTYLNDIPSTIDPCTFWAAGKLYALAATPAPCVMLDTDFIVWHSLSEHLLHLCWLPPIIFLQIGIGTNRRAIQHLPILEMTHFAKHTLGRLWTSCRLRADGMV